MSSHSSGNPEGMHGWSYGAPQDRAVQLFEGEFCNVCESMKPLKVMIEEGSLSSLFKSEGITSFDVMEDFDAVVISQSAVEELQCFMCDCAGCGFGVHGH